MIPSDLLNKIAKEYYLMPRPPLHLNLAKLSLFIRINKRLLILHINKNRIQPIIVIYIKEEVSNHIDLLMDHPNQSNIICLLTRLINQIIGRERNHQRRKCSNQYSK